jgi:polyisoprenoid-binding protein YceI
MGLVYKWSWIFCRALRANYGKLATRQKSRGQARPQTLKDLEEELIMKWQELTLHCMRVMILCFLASFPPLSRAQAPVFEITPMDSSIKFNVKSSATIAGKFDKWDATLKFRSPDETTGVLEITIQAASVDTGSGMKNRKLKSKDFFDAEQNPLIRFKSTKIVRTGPNIYEVDGDFTIRGVSNPEKLTLTISGKEAGSGEIKGAMVFNRKDYGMNSGIPFIQIADHVDVDFHLKGKRVSGPPLEFR